jgi:3-methyl-2-oxobutanoate hydroxymethyltransferase
MNESKNPVTVPEISARKVRSGRTPLVMITAYDVHSAAIADRAGVDLLLVGDSLGMVVQGGTDTLSVSVDDIVYHSRCVTRAEPKALVIADLPWLSYHVSTEETIRNAGRCVQEGRVGAVKLEGGRKRLTAVRALLDAEIPVMGHLGLTPQSVHAMGGYRVQGKDDQSANELRRDALALQEAGIFGLVLEGVPAPLAEKVTAELDIPTIGIGAGSSCDGQVLVWHDLLGLSPDPMPRFVRRYANLAELAEEAVRSFADDVRSGDFPSTTESYGVQRRAPQEA